MGVLASIYPQVHGLLANRANGRHVGNSSHVLNDRMLWFQGARTKIFQAVAHSETPSATRELGSSMDRRIGTTHCRILHHIVDRTSGQRQPQQVVRHLSRLASTSRCKCVLRNRTSSPSVGWSDLVCSRGSLRFGLLASYGLRVGRGRRAASFLV